MVTKFLGIIAAVLFGFGVLGGLVSGSFTNQIVLGHLIIAVVCIFIWAAKVGKDSIGSAKQVIAGRTTSYGAHAVFYTAIFLGILVSVNWIAGHHNKKLDLTEQGVYSLAPQTKELLAKLENPLRLVAFKGLSEDDDKIEDLLRRYKDENPSKVTVEVIDPRSKPHLVEKYQMKQGNLIYIEYGQSSSASNSRINEATEEAVSNAVLKLTRGLAKKIYFLQGHNEADLLDAKADGIKGVALALQDEHLNTEGLLLAQSGKIPQDAAAVVVVAAKQGIPENEKKILIEYANAGGRLLLFHDPQSTNDIADIASKFGITIHNDIVLDQVQRLFSGPEIGAQPIVSDYDKTSPITKALTKQNITVYTMSSSLAKAETPIPGATYIQFAKTSPSAWGETNLKDLLDETNPKAALEANDFKGPVTLGISYEKSIQNPAGSAESTVKKVSRVVVYGSSSWIKNSGLGSYSNRDLLLNSVNWLAGEEGGYTIRAGTIRASTAPISQATFMLILLVSFILPEVILLSGLWIWWSRRFQAVI